MNKIISIAFCALLVACKEPKVINQDPEAKLVKVIVTMNDVGINDTFKINDNTYINFSAFRFYISNLSVNSGNQDILMKDAFLVDFDSLKNEFSFELPENVDALKFGIGVPPGINNGDPTTYSNNHPYSIKGSTGMHWNWNAGYKFVMFDGRLDSTSAGSFNKPFSIHTGNDSLYRALSFPMPNNVRVVQITIDPKDILTNLNLHVENQSHTSGNSDLARRFTDNFVHAIRVDYTLY